MANANPGTELLKTPLHDLHIARGARMVPFAGYAMPLQYPTGIITEHRHTRNEAGLFDVSHMGQAILRGADVATSFEKLVPGDIAGLAPGQMRYTLLLNENGGIRDDLMVTRIQENGAFALFLVVNAACKDADFAYIANSLDGEAALEIFEDRALLALQGPSAEVVLAELAPTCRDLVFLEGRDMDFDGVSAFGARAGYTGEDGFELILKADQALQVTQNIFAAGRSHDISPAGLGARDTLRMESAMPLYGHELNEQLNPLEAGLGFAVNFQNQAGNDRDFIGCHAIGQTKTDGVKRTRIGLQLEGKRAAREGYAIFGDGQIIGEVTSGSFSPTLQYPIAMGYVNQSDMPLGSALEIDIRGKMLPAITCQLPFYKRT